MFFLTFSSKIIMPQKLFLILLLFILAGCVSKPGLDANIIAQKALESSEKINSYSYIMKIYSSGAFLAELSGDVNYADRKAEIELKIGNISIKSEIENNTVSTKLPNGTLFKRNEDFWSNERFWLKLLKIAEEKTVSEEKNYYIISAKVQEESLFDTKGKEFLTVNIKVHKGTFLADELAFYTNTGEKLIEILVFNRK
jgi:hypothetical protein